MSSASLGGDVLEEDFFENDSEFNNVAYIPVHGIAS